jgi:3-phenylpropionate/trans-cinnamate dioxygenase ferredoxin component
MEKLVKVCRVTDLKLEEKIAITTSDESILVVNHEGRFYALSNLCTHEKVELVNGFLIEDSIVCPAHLSKFNLGSGEVLNPPAVMQLKTYEIVLQNDEVDIKL